MPASRATVLRLVTRTPMPDAPAPIWIGIDDYAIGKGSRYGTGDSVGPACVDQSYMGERAAKAAADHGIVLEMVKLPETKHRFFLLSPRRVIESAFCLVARFLRLVRDYERLPITLHRFYLIDF